MQPLSDAGAFYWQLPVLKPALFRAAHILDEGNGISVFIWMFVDVCCHLLLLKTVQQQSNIVILGTIRT